MALNSWYLCLHLLSALITDMYHHTQVDYSFLKTFSHSNSRCNPKPLVQQNNPIGNMLVTKSDDLSSVLDLKHNHYIYFCVDVCECVFAHANQWTYRNQRTNYRNEFFTSTYVDRVLRFELRSSDLVTSALFLSN